MKKKSVIIITCIVIALTADYMTTFKTNISWVEDVVRKESNKEDGKLRKSDLDKVRIINDVDSDDAMEYINLFKNLEDLTMSCMSRSDDIDFLKNNKNLKKLSLLMINSEIKKIDELKDLENLEELNLVEAHIENIDFFSNLKNLKKLSIRYSDIKDWSGLSKLTNLEELEISYCDLDENGANELISNFDNLKYLELNGKLIKGKQDDIEEAQLGKSDLDQVIKLIQDYSLLDYNSKNYDYDKIKKLMESDPKSISEEDYYELMKIFTKLSKDRDMEGIEKFIQNSYIYNETESISYYNKEIQQSIAIYTKPLRDPIKDNFIISPVYKEMNNRYQAMVASMIEGIGDDIFSSEPSDVTKNVLKFISNSDVLNSFINQASDIYMPLEKLDINIERSTKLFGEEDYNISLNGCSTITQMDGENIKFNIFGFCYNQGQILRNDLINKVDIITKNSMENIPQYGVVAAGQIKEIRGINSLINKIEKENQVFHHVGAVIDLLGYSDGLAIRMSLSVSPYSKIVIQNACVDLEEAKFRVWYFRNKVGGSSRSIEKYVSWYRSGGESDIQHNRKEAYLEYSKNLSPESQIKSLEELISNQ